MAKTYAALLQDVQDWASNDDTTFVAEFPHILEMVELELSRRLRHLDFFQETDSSKTLSAATATLTPPTDTVTVRGIWATISSERYPIYRRSLSFCNAYWPNRSRTVVWPNRSRAHYYAEIDRTTWLFVPTPTAAVSLEIDHTIRPTGLDAVTVTSNWFTDNAYDLLLAGVMKYCETWDKSWEAKKNWDAEFERLGADVGGEGWTQNRDEASSQKAEGE